MSEINAICLWHQQEKTSIVCVLWFFFFFFCRLFVCNSISISLLYGMILLHNKLMLKLFLPYPGFPFPALNVYAFVQRLWRTGWWLIASGGSLNESLHYFLKNSFINFFFFTSKCLKQKNCYFSFSHFIVINKTEKSMYNKQLYQATVFCNCVFQIHKKDNQKKKTIIM